MTLSIDEEQLQDKVLFKSKNEAMGFGVHAKDMIIRMVRNRALMKHHQKNDFKKRIELIENSVSGLKFNLKNLNQKLIQKQVQSKLRSTKKIAQKEY